MTPDGALAEKEAAARAGQPAPNQRFHPSLRVGQGRAAAHSIGVVIYEQISNEGLTDI